MTSISISKEDGLFIQDGKHNYMKFTAEEVTIMKNGKLNYFKRVDGFLYYSEDKISWLAVMEYYPH